MWVCYNLDNPVDSKEEAIMPEEKFDEKEAEKREEKQQEKSA